MKSITIIALVFTTISLCQAEDDGKYRPEIGNNERYQKLIYDNRYKNLVERNSKYGSIYNGYNPFYYQALNRELQSPFLVNYGDSVEIPSAYPTAVTYRNPAVPVTTTYRPLVYSTPKPFIATKSPSVIYHKTGLDSAANIIRQDSNSDEKGYHYAFETDNGIAAEESGAVDSSHNGIGGTRVRGFYEYIGDDGLKYRVDYIADENGYRASGAHLPKAPGTN